MKLPRDPTIHLTTTTTTTTTTSSSSSPRNRATSHFGNTRPRHLTKPEETKEVRKRGACHRCRIARRKCDAFDVCAQCKKLCEKQGSPYDNETCIRKTLSETLGAVAVRWNSNDPNFSMPSRQQFDGGEHLELYISFSNSPGSPRLKINAKSFTMPNNMFQKNRYYGIEPSSGPEDKSIYQWAEDQILFEERIDFETRMEKLLRSYVRSNGLEKAITSEQRCLKIVQTQKTLMLNLLKMRCMWKVKSCKEFFVARPGEKAVALPQNLTSIQDHLRLFAEQAMSTLERDVLKDIDTYLFVTDIRKEEQVLSAAVNIAMWISLWQIILLYRRSLLWALYQQGTKSAPVTIVDSASFKRHSFRDMTLQLFNGVVVIYAELFRTSRALDSISKVTADVFGNDVDLHLTFQDAWRGRQQFCELSIPRSWCWCRCRCWCEASCADGSLQTKK
ncbi:hypothetical protein B0T22DRAFT_454394 [Podospora appendiculata]|uniref:Zn(2)-C6 fungal-type domain-containing protein n=1 Tax=Podospora appendiculata TaxID=314037 RepID=A0AAE1CHW2_9PEZI|nr:hypothetical protein B0T22DRAFT_454394 [Podospora appendiculata]